MNILIIMPEIQSGGAERQFIYLRNGLIDKGHDVSILLTQSKDNLNYNKVYSLRKDSRFFAVQELLLMNRIMCINKEKRIDWIIVYDVYGHYLIAFLKMSGFRVLFSERNSGEHKNFIGRMFIKYADKITANSESAVKILQSSIKRNDIVCINNGVDCSNQLIIRYHQRLIDKPGKIIACIPAKICRVKNQLEAIKAVLELPNIELHMAGKIAEQDYYDEIKRVINNENVHDRVIYDGYITNMKEYYERFDVIILPSITEGTPNIVLEAYALGIVCVVSDIEMNMAICKEKTLSYHLYDSEDLKRKLVLLSEADIIYLQNVVKKNYDFVKENHSTSAMVKKYIEVMSK